MITTVDRQRVARALLTYVAEPGDPVLAAWLEIATPGDAIDAIIAGRPPLLPTAGPLGLGDLQAEKVEHAFGLWRQRLGDLPAELDLDAFRREGIRLVCPGDSEWPTQLDTLGVARPYALWLRGEADLRYCCLQSVSMVGARASSAYGEHVGTEMAAALAERGWTVVSGGAYGIDGCAHRGALAADGVTIAVLACGVDHVYPAGHQDLLASVAAQGVLVSEWPPGRTPTKLRFLIRNRVIGALTRGTVVVEAGLRSGALNTARHARDLRRPVMAVPGPVTSEVSAGCHKIIREWGAVCVTDAHDVLELLTPLGGIPAYGSAAGRAAWFPAPDPATNLGPATNPGPATGLARAADPANQAGPADTGRALLTIVRPASTGQRDTGQRDALLPRAELAPATRRVLEAVPARGAGPAVIAVGANLDIDTVVSALGLLAAGGFVERCARGWRLRRSP
jgi:DNA processing protein